jgi:hypothetical protein
MMAGATGFKHNRKRNSGLVYELLVREMASRMLAGDRDGCAEAARIVGTYYSSGAPIAQERELFEVLRSTRGVSETVARKVIGEVARRAAKLDKRKLEIKKSNLIKEVNYSFGRDLFSRYRLPEYRLFASIQMLIDGGNGQLSENVQRIKIEEALVRFMMSGVQEVKRPEHVVAVDGLACALAAKRFQEKYGTTLSREQKTLLEGYMLASVSGDTPALERLLADERKRISGLLTSARKNKEFRDDNIMRERLDEAISRLVKFDSAPSSEESVAEIMLYQRLVAEINSDE